MVFLVTEDLGVVEGEEEEGAAFSRNWGCCWVGVALGVGRPEAGRLDALGVEGVAVEVVFEVVDERGREGIREAGLEPFGAPLGVSCLGLWSMLARCMRGWSEEEEWESCFDRERDLERVRKLYIWTTTYTMSGHWFVATLGTRHTLLSSFVRLEGLSSRSAEHGNFISSEGLSWISFMLSSPPICRSL